MINDVKANYANALCKYCDFSGRASRKEFWTFALTNFVIQLALNLGVVGLWYLTAMDLSIVSGLFTLAILLPSLAVAVRRLHDTNRTGWWELMSFVPVVGGLTLLVLYCLPGSAENNKYGSKPKEIGMDPEQIADRAENELLAAANKIKQACVEALTAEKQAEAALQKKKQEMETWEKRAAQAVNNNDDDMARRCLAKKLESNLAIQALTAQLQMQKETSSSLKAKYSEMQEQLRAFQIKKSELQARAKAASASETSYKANSSGSSGANRSAAMDRYEENLRKKEAMNEALHEVNQASSGSASSGSANSADLASNLELEDELAEMKRKVASVKDQ